MKLPLIANSIRDRYSRKALNEVKKIVENVDKKSHNRPQCSGITIDQYKSPDLDDGIWAYWDTKTRQHVMQVSISDVTEIIPKGSALDWEALSRATSVYFEHHTIHMYPEQIATDIASLNHQTHRLALTCEMRLDENFDLQSIDIFESVFYNKNRLDYEKFAEFISDKNSELYEDLNYFLDIARNLAPKRKHLKFSDDDRKICINSSCSETEESLAIPSYLIEEWMIFTNMCVAIWMHERGIVATFRNHMPEYKNKEYSGELQRAFYHPQMMHHYALGIDPYCHFTSPIRRYSDDIVHRQIKAFLNPNKYTEYQYNEVEGYSLYINEQVYELRKLQTKKEYADKIKEHDRICIKIAMGEEIEDYSRISVHSFDEILLNLLLNKKRIPDKMRNHILKRLEIDVIKGELLYSLFFLDDEKIANKAFYIIHKNSLQKPFFAFVSSLEKFKVSYYRYTEKKDKRLHCMNISYNSEIISTVTKMSEKGNIRNELSKDLFTKFREWRDIEYFKKEKKFKSLA
jgi:exoribonuclease R